MAEGIFNIVAKNVEIKHVPQKVNPAGVHKHRRDKSVESLPVDYFVWNHYELVADRA
jgi:hypothetical protein